MEKGGVSKRGSPIFAPDVADLPSCAKRHGVPLRGARHRRVCRPFNASFHGFGLYFL
jgi:hypothetical protein